MFSWCSCSGSSCLLLTLMASVFPMLIWSPVFSAFAATRQSFSRASCCLWERRLMSSAKSRSSSCFVKVHWMPVLWPTVDWVFPWSVPPTLLSVLPVWDGVSVLVLDGVAGVVVFPRQFPGYLVQSLHVSLACCSLCLAGQLLNVASFVLPCTSLHLSVLLPVLSL